VMAGNVLSESPERLHETHPPAWPQGRRFRCGLRQRGESITQLARSHHSHRGKSPAGHNASIDLSRFCAYRTLQPG
jgi:hypothetical protein